MNINPYILFAFIISAQPSVSIAEQSSEYQRQLTQSEKTDAAIKAQSEQIAAAIKENSEKTAAAIKAHSQQQTAASTKAELERNASITKLQLERNAAITKLQLERNAESTKAELEQNVTEKKAQSARTVASHEVPSEQFLVNVKWMPLIIVFIVYLIMVFVFGCIYYYYFNKDKSYFFFLKEIERGKCEQDSTHITKILNELKNEADLIKKYIKDNKDGHIKPKIKKNAYATEYFYELKDGCSITIKVRHFCDSPNRDWVLPNEMEIEPEYYYSISFLDPSSNIKWSSLWSTGSGYWFTTDIEYSDPMNRIINETFDSIQKDIEYLEMCREQPNWSYMDFVYFSTITQCTVGYGDILPNHTKIRIFVIIQVMLGYSILVVFINIILLP
jgi:hypothetical protein